jgi:CRISPR-associated endoribonuclease Cas6
MRFRLLLERTSKPGFIPINYQYELSAAIYRIIDQGDSNFARYLHNTGYVVDNKPFRLFTFSRLNFEGYKIHKENGRIEHVGLNATLTVSFLIDKAAEEFIKGVFLKASLYIGDKISGAHYTIRLVEAQAPAYFSETMHYTCISPVLLKRKRITGGEDYLSPTHQEFAKILISNLLNKARAFTTTVNTSLLWEDHAEIAFKTKGEIKKNGVTLKAFTPETTKMIAYIFDFELTMPTYLHEIGYHAGFGHLNSQGFGCVEVNEESYQKTLKSLEKYCVES